MSKLQERPSARLSAAAQTNRHTLSSIPGCSCLQCSPPTPVAAAQARCVSPRAHAGQVLKRHWPAAWHCHGHVTLAEVGPCCHRGVRPATVDPRPGIQYQVCMRMRHGDERLPSAVLLVWSVWWGCLSSSLNKVLCALKLSVRWYPIL